MSKQATINDVLEILIAFKDEMLSFKSATERRFDESDYRLDCVRNSLSGEIGSLRAEMHEGFKSVREDINAIASDLVKVQRQIQRKRSA